MIDVLKDMDFLTLPFEEVLTKRLALYIIHLVNIVIFLALCIIARIEKYQWESWMIRVVIWLDLRITFKQLKAEHTCT